MLFRSIRQELKANIDQEGTLKVYNQNIEEFVICLFKESQEMLGSMPKIKALDQLNPTTIKFCVMSLGSLSRKMLSAYSDLEYGMLTEFVGDYVFWEKDVLTLDRYNKYSNPEKKQAKFRADYLRIFTELFEFKIRILGETGRGLQLDEASQPRYERSVLGTPESIVSRCVSQEVDAHDGIVYSLIHARYLYGDKGLFEQYQKELNKKYKELCRQRKIGRAHV